MDDNDELGILAGGEDDPESKDDGGAPVTGRELAKARNRFDQLIGAPTTVGSGAQGSTLIVTIKISSSI